MSAPPIIAPAAQTDIETAYHWYESLQVGTGDPFLGDLQAALAAIEQNPERYGVVNRRTRAAPLTSHKSAAGDAALGRGEKKNSHIVCVGGTAESHAKPQRRQGEKGEFRAISERYGLLRSWRLCGLA